MPLRYIVSSVWVRQGIFSHLSNIQYVGLCVFSLHISLVMIERIYMLCLIIIIKSEVWTITHCLLRVMSWNNGVRCMSFCTLILIKMHVKLWFKTIKRCSPLYHTYGPTIISNQISKKYYICRDKRNSMLLSAPVSSSSYLTYSMTPVLLGKCTLFRHANSNQMLKSLSCFNPEWKVRFLIVFNIQQDYKINLFA